MMDWMDCFYREMDALDQQLEDGTITQAQHRTEVRELRRDAQDLHDREEIIAAGRGHLLR